VVDRLRRRFAIARVCVVADRGIVSPLKHFSPSWLYSTSCHGSVLELLYIARAMAEFDLPKRVMRVF
jgi:hypothetical protein